MDLTLQCRCGAMQGVARDIEKSTAPRVLCYCNDCQRYARHLGADAILDAEGGSDIVPLAPSHFTITKGAEHLRCLRLTPKGLHRFYAGCCRTPIGNTVSARVPYIGMVRPFLDTPRVGPVRSRVGGKYRTVDPRFLLRVFAFMGKNLVLGRGRPSALFDEAGKPRVVPEVLTQP